MDTDIVYAKAAGERPYVIVFGSEKGGTGKSTAAMNVAVALAKMGYAVGSIDFDARQGTLSRYIANRSAEAAATGITLTGPEHIRVGLHEAIEGGAASASQAAWARGAFEKLGNCDFIVADTPGGDTFLSRLAHVNADTLITPLNDSLVDIDVIARLDPVKREALGAGIYTQMVWEQNNRRAAAGLSPIDWILMRNRLAHIQSRNKMEIAGLMGQLARRIGFRVAPGFGERVIFRELFLKGLTLLDIPEGQADDPRSSSRIAARGELDALLETIGISAPQQVQGAPATAA